MSPMQIQQQQMYMRTQQGYHGHQMPGIPMTNNMNPMMMGDYSRVMRNQQLMQQQHLMYGQPPHVYSQQPFVRVPPKPQQMVTKDQ